MDQKYFWTLVGTHLWYCKNYLNRHLSYYRKSYDNKILNYIIKKNNSDQIDIYLNKVYILNSRHFMDTRYYNKLYTIPSN